MESMKLGPNASLIHCMRMITQDTESFIHDWLLPKILEQTNENDDEISWIVFDLPGQVELTTCDTSLLILFRSLEKIAGFRV